ncbi:MAG: glycosyltransferase family 2 protein, partial [Cyclobacteriaceae bacterium]|nr:glycosyltransferase family 2 protein [Cyclobacteriaceae bacterium]
MKNLYLQRYAWPGPIISDKPKPGTKIIVVIPCYNEPNALESLESIYNCESPDCTVEVITVVNHAENESSVIKNYNFNTFNSIITWIKNHSKNGLSFYVIKAFDLPKKQAGVGLARKIGMDEAVRRFESLHEKKGILVCYDADCLCSPNYLKEIYQFYKTTPETNAALVYFEHPLEGNFDNAVYDGIVNYELHLRYYKNALKIANFPYSVHTIGSCITVTSEA